MKNKDLNEFKNFKIVEKKGSDLNTGNYFFIGHKGEKPFWAKISDVTSFHSGIQIKFEELPELPGIMIHPNQIFKVKVIENFEEK